MLYKDIGQRIKAVIKESGRTQAQVADYCGVTRQAITGWVATNSINKNNLAKLCEYTGANINWILNEQGEMFNSSQAKKGVEEKGAPYASDVLELASEIEKLPAAKRAQLQQLVKALNINVDTKAG